jgi:hypothetical protein
MAFDPQVKYTDCEGVDFRRRRYLILPVSRGKPKEFLRPLISVSYTGVATFSFI